MCDLADDKADQRCKSNEEASVLLGMNFEYRASCCVCFYLTLPKFMFTPGEDLLQTLAQHLPAHVLGAPGERDVWICKLCGAQELNVASYARHLMTHYRQQASDYDQPKCFICMKRFLSKKVVFKLYSRLKYAEHTNLSIYFECGSVTSDATKAQFKVP